MKGIFIEDQSMLHFCCWYFPDVLRNLKRLHSYEKNDLQINKQLFIF